MDGEFAAGFVPDPATSHRVFRTSKSQTWNKRRCVEHPANTPSPAHPYLLLHTLFPNCLPQPIQIRCPQRPVIQSISCSSGLAPRSFFHDQGGYSRQSHCHTMLLRSHTYPVFHRRTDVHFLQIHYPIS